MRVEKKTDRAYEPAAVGLLWIAIGRGINFHRLRITVQDTGSLVQSCAERQTSFLLLSVGISRTRVDFIGQHALVHPGLASRAKLGDEIEDEKLFWKVDHATRPKADTVFTQEDVHPNFETTRQNWDLQQIAVVWLWGTCLHLHGAILDAGWAIASYQQSPLRHSCSHSHFILQRRCQLATWWGASRGMPPGGSYTTQIIAG